MFFFAWIIRAIYYVFDLIFTNVLQTLYDRMTGKAPSRNGDQHRSNMSEIRILPPTPPWVYVLGIFVMVVLIDRVTVFAGYYSEYDDDARWARDTLNRMCNDDQRYRGRMYADTCMTAHKIKQSGRFTSSIKKTIDDTHLCIWWDCTTLTYNTLTSIPSLTALIVVLLITLLMCGGGFGGGSSPQTIMIPNLSNFAPEREPDPLFQPQESTPNTPSS